MSVDEFLSPLYGRTENGAIRTWPLFAGPIEPEDLHGWEQPVPDGPLPLLVLPGPLHEGEVGPGA